MDEHRFSPPAVGGSSLLISFAVLCFTIFALLALETVQAGKRLSDAASAAASAYYRADCAAEAILAQLRSGQMPENVSIERTSQGELCTYSCPISDTQVLEVEVLLHGRDWTIRRWQTVSSSDWTTDDHIQVWDGSPIAGPGH